MFWSFLIVNRACQSSQSNWIIDVIIGPTVYLSVLTITRRENVRQQYCKLNFSKTGLNKPLNRPMWTQPSDYPKNTVSYTAYKILTDWILNTWTATKSSRPQRLAPRRLALVDSPTSIHLISGFNSDVTRNQYRKTSMTNESQAVLSVTHLPSEAPSIGRVENWSNPVYCGELFLVTVEWRMRVANWINAIVSILTLIDELVFIDELSSNCIGDGEKERER